MSIRDSISGWTHGPDWKTWVAHSVIALVIFTPAALVFGADVGAAAAIGYYLIRELEQIIYTVVDRKPLGHWVDHVMDVLAPAAVCLAAAGIASLF